MEQGTLVFTGNRLCTFQETLKVFACIVVNKGYIFGLYKVTFTVVPFVLGQPSVATRPCYPENICTPISRFYITCSRYHQMQNIKLDDFGLLSFSAHFMGYIAMGS